MIEYKYNKKENKFTENGHTMFEEDVLKRLKRLSYLEEQIKHSKLHQPTVISAVCDCQKRTGGYCAVCLSSTENCKCTFIPQTDL